MGWVFDSLGEALTGSFDLKGLWKYYVILAILILVAAFIIELAVLWLPVLLILGMSFTQILTSPETVMLNLLSSLPSIIIMLLVVIIIYILVEMLLEAIITGFELNIAKDYISKAKLSFSSAWDKTAPRFITLFIVNVVVGILLTLLLLVFLAPAIMLLLNNLPSITAGLPSAVVGSMFGSNTAAYGIYSLLIGIMLMFIIGILIYFIVLFFLMPILAMVMPVVIFEKKGVIGSLKRAVEVGKKEYLATLGYLILTGLVFAAATIIYMLVAMPLSFIGIVGSIIFLIVLVIYLVWAMAFSSLAITKLYQAKAGIRAVSSSAGKPARKLAKRKK